MICVSQATAKVYTFILLFASIILQPNTVEPKKPLELKFANFLQPQSENSKTQLTSVVRSRHYLAQHTDSNGPIVSNKSDLSIFDFLIFDWFK